MTKYKYFHKDLGHTDSPENAFLRRELEHVRSETFNVEFPENKGRMFLDIDRSVNTGAESFSFALTEGVGQARVGAGGYAGDAPRVDVKISEEIQRIVPITASYGYSMQELRNARFAGRPLDALRGRVAREVIETAFDTLMLLGSAEEGMAGLFTLSNTTAYTVPNGAAASQSWDLKTPAEIIKDLNAIGDAIVNFTNEVEVPDSLLLPTSAYQLIQRTRMADGSDVTILKHFLENSMHIKNVDYTFKLQTVGASSSRRMVAYKKDPTRVRGVIPQEFEQLAPETRGYETIVNCHARWGGLEVRRPKSIAYGDSI